MLNGSRRTGPPDHAPDRAQENAGAGPAQRWDERVPPGLDGTLLAVVPIPGTGTSLAIVGYAITTSAASPPPRPAATRTRRPQSSGLRLDLFFAHGISLGEPAGSADVDVEEVQ